MSRLPAPQMRRFAMPMFAVLVVVSAAFILATVDGLPGVVASHFGPGSGPNGWMVRSDYLIWMLILALVAPCLIVLLIAGLPRIAPRLLNLPHRAYWLAEERRADTLATLLAFACWQGSLLTLFAAGLHLVLLEANRVTPPRLSVGSLSTLLVLFVAAILAWTAALYARFRTMR
jgi:hypothetical protein